MRNRITPAYAGKSMDAILPACIRRDHPRLCGEKALQSPQNPRSSGSPPPMRGKVVLSAAFAAGVGITPAYAGKSFMGPCTINGHWDHPRLCGEKYNPVWNGCRTPGSPPPMRGKAGNPCIAGNQCRITPAYAGKSRR